MAPSPSKPPPRPRRPPRPQNKQLPAANIIGGVVLWTVGTPVPGCPHGSSRSTGHPGRGVPTNLPKSAILHIKEKGLPFGSPFCMVREGGVEGIESTPKLPGLPWSFGSGGRCSPSVRRRRFKNKLFQYHTSQKIHFCPIYSKSIDGSSSVYEKIPVTIK